MSLSFPVSTEKHQALIRRFEELQILDNDLKETFIRSGGNGGQNVNKVSTAVFLIHIPSGLSVKCSVYRTQGLNRYKARALLCDKIAEWKFGLEPKVEKKRLKIIKRKKEKVRKSRRKKILDASVRERENSIRDST